LSKTSDIDKNIKMTEKVFKDF